MKKIRIIALAIAFLVIFGGCGAKNMAAEYESYDYATSTEAFDGNYWAVTEEAVEEMEMPESEKVSDNFSDGAGQSQAIPETGRKLIRNFELSIETLEFEDFVSVLKAEVASLGGYIENSGISGNSYNYSSNRSANFVCRVPSDKAEEFLGTVGGLGNVTYSYESADDVTLAYVDTEARIKSLQTEYDRLLELLAEAENIDSVILLQQRLTEVRYQLESYQSLLRTYDNLVDYSTFTINVSEVKRVTSAEKESVFERIKSDFSDNIYDIWVGLQDFIVWFAASVPYFLIWGIVIALIILAVRFILNRNPRYKERKAARKAAKAYKKAQKLAEKNETKTEEEQKEEE